MFKNPTECFHVFLFMLTERCWLLMLCYLRLRFSMWVPWSSQGIWDCVTVLETTADHYQRYYFYIQYVAFQPESNDIFNQMRSVKNDENPWHTHMKWFKQIHRYPTIKLTAACNLFSAFKPPHQPKKGSSFTPLDLSSSSSKEGFTFWIALK